MARTARERFVVTHDNYRVNNHSVKGLVAIMLGECVFDGKQKNAAGKKIPAEQCDCYLLRWEDKKLMKQLRIPTLEFAFSKKRFSSYFDPQP